MAYEYNISEDGLELIKAYEGFRPVETALVSGQKVIGYGHSYVLGEASLLTQKKAEEILKADIAPIEKIINHIVHAPLSQGQFDALVSLAFNIGIDAFSESTVLHYLNNGQPLAAAAGFDEWRKSIIAEKTYVIDALVRRRTAEKALFLHPALGIVAAPRYEVPPLHDDTVKSGEDDIEVFSTSDEDGFVEQAPYAEPPVQEPHSEDDAAAAVMLSERAAAPQIYEDTLDEPSVNDTVSEDVVIDNVVEIQPEFEAEAEAEAETETESEVAYEHETEFEQDEDMSPIAIAAADVSERLDNLMEETDDEALAENIVTNETEALDAEVVSETEIAETEVHDIEMQEFEPVEHEAVEHEYVEHETMVSETLEADVMEFEGDTTLEQPTPKKLQKRKVKGAGAFWTALVVGLLLIGGSLWKMKFSPITNMGAMDEFLAPVILLVGAMMIMGGMFYMVKAQLRRTAK